MSGHGHFVETRLCSDSSGLGSVCGLDCVLPTGRRAFEQHGWYHRGLLCHARSEPSDQQDAF